MTHTRDPATDHVAYRAGYSLTRDYLWVAHVTGRPLDVAKLRADLAAVVDVSDPEVERGMADALRGEPSRWQ